MAMHDGDDLNEEILRQMRRAKNLSAIERDIYFRQKRRKRLTFLVISIAGLVSTVLLLFKWSVTPDLLVVLTLATAFSIFALFYLQPNTFMRSESARLEQSFRLREYINNKISDAISELKTKGQKNLEFGEKEKADILSSIRAKLESEALVDYVDGIKKQILGNVHKENLEDHFHLTRQRLSQEVQDLSRRGNLNLVLGIFTTLSGLSVLGYAVFNPPILQSPQELFAYFVPRISLVILIEVFAYFFLSLYKQSLGEIKYFQNELTNVEAKHLGLLVALRSEEPSLRARLVEELARTERNFVLNKGQTTVELEKDRLAVSMHSGITDAIRDAFAKSSK